MQGDEEGKLVSRNSLVPAWLPSEIGQRIDTAKFAIISESAFRELEAEAEALKVYLVAYRHEHHPSKGRLQLCACIKIADIDQDVVRRLNGLQTRLGVVLVAYARPLRPRV